VAVPTTLNGEAILALAPGLETLSGKLLEPLPHAAVEGFSAVGAGDLLLVGVQVIASAGAAG